jgi:Trk K+ transport system NAD-binding subunit
MVFARMVPPPSGPKRRGVIIVGQDPPGVLLGERLKLSGEEVSFIVHDSAQAAKIKSAGFKVVQGVSVDQRLLEKAGAARAESLVLLSGDEQEITEVCHLGKTHFMIPTMVGLTQNQDAARVMEAMDVSVVHSSLATALALEGAIHFPAEFEMLTDLSYGLELADASVRNPAMAGQFLKRISLPGGVLVMGIKRQGEAIVPDGETQLRFNDVLTLIGKPNDLRPAREVVEGRGETRDNKAPTQ